MSTSIFDKYTFYEINSYRYLHQQMSHYWCIEKKLMSIHAYAYHAAIYHKNEISLAKYKIRKNMVQFESCKNNKKKFCVYIKY